MALQKGLLNFLGKYDNGFSSCVVIKATGSQLNRE